jgi:hypothetical protein
MRKKYRNTTVPMAKGLGGKKRARAAKKCKNRKGNQRLMRVLRAGHAPFVRLAENNPNLESAAMLVSVMEHCSVVALEHLYLI